MLQFAIVVFENEDNSAKSVFRCVCVLYASADIYNRRRFLSIRHYFGGRRGKSSALGEVLNIVLSKR